MEPQLVPVLLNLMAANLGLTILVLLLVLLHSWGLLLYLRHGFRELSTSLQRIEASAEHIATMVHDLHRNR